MSVIFRINDELVDITVPDDDEEMRLRLTNDNPFTLKMLKKYVKTGKIIMPEPIRLVTRLLSDTEEELIYNEESLEHLEPISNGELTGNAEFIFNEELPDNEKPMDNDERPHNEDLPHDLTDSEESIGNDELISHEEPATQIAEEPELNDVPNNSSNTSRSKKRRASELWADNHTKLILDNFHTYLTDIGPMKRFKTKKHMWKQVAKDLSTKHKIIKSAVQVENRYKTIVRRKKDATVNNSQTGRSRQTVPFAKEMSKIASLDDSIAPQIIRSARSLKTFKEPAVTDNSESDDETPLSGRKKYKPTVQTNKKKKRRGELPTSLKPYSDSMKREKRADKHGIQKNWSLFVRSSQNKLRQYYLYLIHNFI